MNRRSKLYKISAFCLALILAFSPLFENIEGAGIVYAQEEEETQQYGEEQPQEDYSEPYDTSNDDAQQEEWQNTTTVEEESSAIHEEDTENTMTTTTASETTSDEWNTLEGEINTEEDDTQENTTEEETTEENTSEEETTTEEETETETETELEEEEYIWLDMTDGELAEWLMNEDNAAEVWEILHVGDDPTQEQIDKYESLYSRIEAILDGEDEELAEQLMMYLSELMELEVAPLATCTVTITYDSNGWTEPQHTQTETVTVTNNKITVTLKKNEDFGDKAFSFPMSEDVKTAIKDDLEANGGTIPGLTGWATEAYSADNKSAPTVYYKDGATVTFSGISNYATSYNITLFAVWDNFKVLNYITFSGQPEGFYQLRDNITGRTIPFEASGNFVIDLNGWTWKGTTDTSDEKYYAYGVIEFWKPDATAYIVDSNPNKAHYGNINDSNKRWEYVSDNSGSGDVVINGGVIWSNLCIEGGSAIRMGESSGNNAKNKGYTFPVSNCKLYMYGGTFAGNYQTSSGGGGSGIRIDGNNCEVVMKGGNICYNTTANIGGGIYVTGKNATVTISGGSIENNRAVNSGGGIYVASGTVNIEGGTIKGNEATTNGKGGGIYVASGTVNISGGNLDSNTATADGGGIYVASGTINIKNTTENDDNIITVGTIQNNKATNNGGGIYVANGTVKIMGGTIQNNTATTYNGGGIVVNNGSVIIGEKNTDSTITDKIKIQNNTAKVNGGGIYANGGEITINDGYISENTAVNGGGIYIVGGTVNVTGGKIRTNKATTNGGGIAVEKGSVIIGDETDTDIEIFENIATKLGGGIYVNGGSITINKGNITSNVAYAGGGVYLAKSDEGEFILNGGNITYNAAVNGGGLYLFKSPTLNAGYIDNNTATISDYTYKTEDNKNANANIKDKIDNISDTSASGGGIYILNAKVILPLSSTDENKIVSVSNNEANNGGGIYINGKDGAASLEVTDGDKKSPINLKIEDNKANAITGADNGYGGGICINYGSCTLNSSRISFKGNSAKNGGGVSVYKGDFTIGKGVTVNVGEIKSPNTAEQNGGGVYVWEGNAYIYGGNIQYNEANNGGGIYVSSGNATVNGGNIISNIAKVDGGGIYVSGGDKSGTDTETDDIKNNNINPDNYNVYISEGNISSNTAAQNGGGISVNNGNVLVDGGTINKNKATSGNGGAVYVYSDGTIKTTVRVRSGTINENSADSGNGGAIAVYGKDGDTSKLKVVIGVNENHYTNGNYTGCEHTYRDYKESHTPYDNCPIITSNTSKVGGGIYISGGTLDIYCIEEKDNSASNDNEGSYELSNFLMVENGKVVITSSDSTDNQSDSKGYSKINSSIHVVGGTLDIYGYMANPQIDAMITVDLKSEYDHFKDHRIYVKDSGEEKIYWIHYYENFLTGYKDDGTSIRTGRFMAFPINKGSDNYEHTIITNLFEREGYEILGWNTDSEGNLNTYNVDDIYHFDDSIAGEKHIQTNAEGKTDLQKNDTTGTEETTLVLYAIWKEYKYTVYFNPNAESYNGDYMPSKSYNIGIKYNLPQNQYSRDGYKFDGWNTKQDGTGESFSDKAEIQDLTTANGEITLYAQWKNCDHQTDVYYTYEVTGNGTHTATVTATCSCKGYWEKLIINGEDTVYDGNEHPATYKYITSQSSTPETLYSDLSEQDILPLSYKYTYELWTTADDGKKAVEGGGKILTGKPIDAGIYEASLLDIIVNQGAVDEDGKITTTKETLTAMVTYTIDKATKEAPDKPTYIITSDDYVDITPAKNAEEGEEYEYAIRYYVNNDLTDFSWGSVSKIELNKEQTTYLVYIRYAETLNYYHSEPAKANSNFYFSGNIKVIVDCEEGIEDVVIGDTNQNVTDDKPITGVTISASLIDGYYLVNPEGFDASYNIVPFNTNDTNKKKLDWKGPEIDKNNGYKEKYYMTEISTDSIITVTIAGVRKIPTVTAKYTDGQVFTDFTGKDIDISNDSAFTAQFTVKDYFSDDYDEMAINFSSELPVGSTVIMREMNPNGKYWYYNVTDENAVSSIHLTCFTEMGGSSKFAYSNTNTSDTTTQLTNGTTYKAETFTYQFIVDTSQVENKTGIRSLNGENITVDLTLVPKEGKNAPKVPEDNCHQLTITMQSAAIFNMEEPAVSVKTATFTCTYNASEGAASIWNDRNMALALTPAGNIPADLYLTVKIGNRNTVCKINRNKQFIIPFTAFGSNTVEVTICSNLFDIGASNYDYTFNAQWFVSASAAGSSPINGYKAGEEKVKFEISKDTTPSLKINGTNHVYNKNSLLNSTLYVTVETKDIPDGATIKAALYRMDSEEDGSINYVKTTGDEDVSTIIGYSHELGAKSSQEAGNYCLRIKVTQNDNELLVVPYYFIILNEDGTITN